jgi:nicotinamidase/pyrazinamidase
VAGTPGAAFAASLRIAPADTVISKATSQRRDAYSALDGTPLADRLRRAGIRRLVIGGLATDYCVRATGLDARAAGLEVVICRDAVCAVNVRPGDGERALAELASAGCEISTTEDVLSSIGVPT